MCVDRPGPRLFFGIFNYSNPPQPRVPQDSVLLMLERRHARLALADVVDGDIELVAGGATVLSGTPSGVAHGRAGFKRGTFAGVARGTGNLAGVRFTGSWTCG